MWELSWWCQELGRLAWGSIYEFGWLVALFSSVVVEIYARRCDRLRAELQEAEERAGHWAELYAERSAGESMRDDVSKDLL